MVQLAKPTSVLDVHSQVVVGLRALEVVYRDRHRVLCNCGSGGKYSCCTNHHPGLLHISPSRVLPMILAGGSPGSRGHASNEDGDACSIRRASARAIAPWGTASASESARWVAHGPR